MKNTLVLFLILALGFSACAKKDYLVTIKTSYGEIKVILYDQTPKHKANFLKLAENGDYDSTIFHRIIKDFMIQGGDIYQKPENKGKEEYTIPAEFVDTLIHVRGALAAARNSDEMNPEKASSGCQWYIVQGRVFGVEELTTDVGRMNQYVIQYLRKPENKTLGQELSLIYQQQGEQAYVKKLLELRPLIEKEFNTSFAMDYPADKLDKYTTIGGAPHLDGAYTVFGRVVQGLDVVDKIADVQTANEMPLSKIYMTMEVESMSPAKLKKLYDIQ